MPVEIVSYIVYSSALNLINIGKAKNWLHETTNNNKGMFRNAFAHKLLGWGSKMRLQFNDEPVSKDYILLGCAQKLPVWQPDLLQELKVIKKQKHENVIINEKN